MHRLRGAIKPILTYAQRDAWARGTSTAHDHTSRQAHTNKSAIRSRRPQALGRGSQQKSHGKNMRWPRLPCAPPGRLLAALHPRETRARDLVRRLLWQSLDRMWRVSPRVNLRGAASFWCQAFHGRLGRAFGREGVSWRQRSGEGWHMVGRGGREPYVCYLHACVCMVRGV